MKKAHFVKGYIESTYCFSMEEAKKEALQIVSRALDLANLGLIQREAHVYAHVYTTPDLFTPVATAVIDPVTGKPALSDYSKLRKEVAA